MAFLVVLLVGYLTILVLLHTIRYETIVYIKLDNDNCDKQCSTLSYHIFLVHPLEKARPQVNLKPPALCMSERCFGHTIAYLQFW